MEEVSRQHGERLALRLLTAASWVHRRVETVAFIASDVAQRKVAVDFDLPVEEPPPWFDRSRQVECVPLTLLEKRTLVAFDLRDESGAALPVLTKRENGWLAWSALVVAAEAVLIDDVLPDVMEDLRLVATGAATDAMAILEGLSTRGDPPSRGQRRLLLDDAGWSSFAADLASNFALVTPVEWLPGRRRIMKYSYVEPIDWPPFHLRTEWKERLGWSDWEFEFPVPRIADCGSYHLEWRVPSELVATKGVFVAQTEEGEVTDDQVHTGDLVHLRLESVPSPASGEVTVALRPSSHGFIRSATLTSLGTAFLLAVATVGSDRIGDRNTEAVAALLLALPGVAATFLVRPGEHTLVSRFLFWPRAVLGASGASAYLGAVCAAFLNGAALRVLLGLCGLAACIFTLALEQTNKRGK